MNSKICVGSKVRIKGKPIKGVSFKVLSKNKYGECRIKHSLSALEYLYFSHELEVLK